MDGGRGRMGGRDGSWEIHILIELHRKRQGQKLLKNTYKYIYFSSFFKRY